MSSVSARALLSPVPGVWMVLEQTPPKGGQTDRPLDGCRGHSRASSGMKLLLPLVHSCQWG